MYWIELEKQEGKKIPKWKRSAAISDEGIVFVPGAIASSEQEVALCAAYDGTPIIRYLNHIYVPADWLASEFRKTEDVCRLISLKVKEIYLSKNDLNDG